MIILKSEYKKPKIKCKLTGLSYKWNWRKLRYEIIETYSCKCKLAKRKVKPNKVKLSSRVIGGLLGL